jgi:hypothetical protein
MTLDKFKVAEGVDIPGVWDLVYEHVFTGPATSNQMPVNSLDGDADGGYLIEILFNNLIAGSVSVLLNYNNDTGDMSSSPTQYVIVNGSSLTAIRNTGTLAMGINCATANWGRSLIHIPFSRTGNARFVSYEHSRVFDSTSLLVVDYRGNMTVPATGVNITSFGIEATTASAIGAGSHFRVWKLKS